MDADARREEAAERTVETPSRRELARRTVEMSGRHKPKKNCGTTSASGASVVVVLEPCLLVRAEVAAARLPDRLRHVLVLAEREVVRRAVRVVVDLAQLVVEVLVGRLVAQDLHRPLVAALTR